MMTNLKPVVDPVKVRAEAIEFARLNAPALARDLIAWQDSALMPDGPHGPLRTLAKMWAAVDGAHSLALAESCAVRAALELTAASAVVPAPAANEDAEDAKPVASKPRTI